MKLSNETLEILKNFAGINTNILFTPGNTIKTVTPSKNMMGKFEAEEEFEIEFGIFNLPNFIATLGFFTDPELTFEPSKNRVVITSGDKKFYYYASAKSQLSIVEKDIKFPDESVVSFEMKKEMFAELLKVSSTLSLPNIGVVSDGKAVDIQVFDIEKDGENQEGNNFKLKLGKGDSSVYKLVFDTENLRFLSDDYDVKIAKHGKGFVAEFKSKTRSLTYYTGLNKNSSFTE